MREGAVMGGEDREMTREETLTKLRAAAEDFARRHMTAARQRVDAAAAVAAAPVLTQGSALEVDQEIASAIDGLDASIRKVELAGQGAAPSAQQIEDALERHAKQNDRPLVRAVAAEVTRRAQASLAAPAERLRVMLVKLRATRRRIRDAEAHVGVVRRELQEAEREVAAEIQAAVESWGG